MADAVNERPRIVCLCGSTRFREAYEKATETETLAGRIVLSIGVRWDVENPLWRMATFAERQRVKGHLDVLHRRKIDMADEVLVLNVGGCIGPSTRLELLYAQQLGKRVRFWEVETANMGQTDA